MPAGDHAASSGCGSGRLLERCAAVAVRSSLKSSNAQSSQVAAHKGRAAQCIAGEADRHLRGHRAGLARRDHHRTSAVAVPPAFAAATTDVRADRHLGNAAAGDAAIVGTGLGSGESSGGFSPSH